MQRIYLFLSFAILFICGCEVPLVGKKTDSLNESKNTYIFVASGTTYAGPGITPSTPSQSIARYRSDGVFDGIVFDYNTLPGDSPVGLVDYDDETLLVAIDNPSGRRVGRIRKDGSSQKPEVFIPAGPGLSTTLRSIVPTFDGGWLIARTTTIEKYNVSKQRITIGANGYVFSPAGACGTTATAKVGVVQGPAHNIIYTHAAGSPNNKTVMIKPTGYAGATDCLSGIAGPTGNHTPTGALLYYNYNGLSRLLVGYSNNTGPVHNIYSYPVSSTTISAGTLAYSNLSVLQGASAMAMMPDGKILIAMSSPTFNQIERFDYNESTHTLTPSATSTFIPTDLFTKSVSAILVAEGNF